jgi:hypothetical protein
MTPLITFGSNLGATDCVAMFREPERWAEPRDLLYGVRFSGLNIMAGTEPYTLDNPAWMKAAGVGPNTYPALVAVDAFRKVRAWGKTTILGADSVKPHDPDGALNTALTLRLIAKIHAAGGLVDVVTLDQPFDAGRRLGQQPSETAEYVRHTIATIRAYYPEVQIGVTSGYPMFNVSELIGQCRLTTPAFFCLDVDRNALRETNWFRRWIDAILGRESALMRKFMADWTTLAFSVPCWVVPILWGQQFTDAKSYWESVMTFARIVRKLEPQPRAVQVESWEFYNGTREIPHNLGQGGHCELVREIADLF